MLITIISIIILVIGICFLIICLKATFNHEFLSWVMTIMLGVGVVGTLLCVIAICIVQPTKRLNYEKMLYKKEVLEYRVEHQEDNIVGNELLYQDIIEFNNQLRNDKRLANNIWTNWFANDLVATIEYVDYKKGEN